MQTADSSVRGEGQPKLRADALCVRAPTSAAYARNVPVSDYFYTQLGPGRFEIASTIRHLDGAMLNRTVIEPLSVGAVVPDPAWIAFVLPIRWTGEYLFNGAQVTPLTLGVCTDRNGYFTRGADRDGIAVGLQRFRFSAALAALRGVPEDEVQLPNGLVRLSQAAIARLRSRLDSMIKQGASSPESSNMDGASEELYELLLDACLSADADSANEVRCARRWADIVRRAEERFVAAAGRSVSLADLCAAAGVGRTALQQAFHGLYGESALSYFHKRRLMRARESMLSAPPERSAVKRAALAAGLQSLGRFSVEYRRLFGERPSVTLNRSDT